MSHREREIVPSERTNERKGVLPLESFTAVWNTEDASVSRGAESAWWCVQFKEVEQIRRSSASDHVVAILHSILQSTGSQCKSIRSGATCSRLGALQTRWAVQFITRWTLFTSCWGIPASRETGRYERRDKNFCGLNSKELTNRSESPDLKVCGLANSVDLLLHGEPTVKHDT